MVMQRGTLPSSAFNTMSQASHPCLPISSFQTLLTCIAEHDLSGNVATLNDRTYYDQAQITLSVKVSWPEVRCGYDYEECVCLCGLGDHLHSTSSHFHTIEEYYGQLQTLQDFLESNGPSWIEDPIGALRAYYHEINRACLQTANDLLFKQGGESWDDQISDYQPVTTPLFLETVNDASVDGGQGFTHASNQPLNQDQRDVRVRPDWQRNRTVYTVCYVDP